MCLLLLAKFPQFCTGWHVRRNSYVQLEFHPSHDRETRLTPIFFQMFFSTGVTVCLQVYIKSAVQFPIYHTFWDSEPYREHAKTTRGTTVTFIYAWFHVQYSRNLKIWRERVTSLTLSPALQLNFRCYELDLINYTRYRTNTKSKLCQIWSITYIFRFRIFFKASAVFVLIKMN